MPAIDWPRLVGWETLSVGAAVAIAYLRGRMAVRESTEHPERRAAAVFAFARWTTELPFLTLIAPYLMWYFGRGKPGSEGAGDWLFAVGWTALIVAWFGMVRIHSDVRRDAGMSGATPAAVLGTHLFVNGWLIVPPLFAGWAVVALDAGPPMPHEPDPTAALCYVVALALSSHLLAWPVRRCMAAASDVPAPVLAEFERLAGEGARPAVVAAPLRRLGLSHGLAHRHKRTPRISIDDAFAACATPAEAAAILLHELGHHRLGHLRRRAWTWKACLIAALIGPTLLGFGHVAVFVAGMWVLHRFVLLRLWRRYELQADRFAADRCGAAALANALVVLHRAASVPDEFGRARRGMTHPELRQRIAALGLDPADYLAPRAA